MLFVLFCAFFMDGGGKNAAIPRHGIVRNAVPTGNRTEGCP